MSAEPSEDTWLMGALCALAFTVLLGYAICGAAAQSLYLEAYGSDGLPTVWLAVALASAVTVSIVNRAARSLDVIRLFWRASILSALFLVLMMGLHMLHVPGMAFAIYVWKEIYVVVLVELFWTFANVAFGVHSASTLYGWFCAAGSLGGVVGSLMLGPMAHWMGTFHTLWLTLPCILAPAWGCHILGHHAHQHLKAPNSDTDLRAGWRLLKSSRYLGLMVLLVGTVQVVLTVMEYQFNQVMELAYPLMDERTGVIGDVYAVITGLSLVLQVGTSIILRFVGVGPTLIAIPAVMGACVVAFMGLPGFATMAVVKIYGKSADYSLFRAAKEILYIPLSYAEKTRGKALVDMLTYRAAKGGASLLLVWLATFGATHNAINWLNLSLCAVWLALTLVIVRRHRQLTTQI